MPIDRMDDVLKIRHAAATDILVLAHHRVSMCRDMHIIAPASEDALREAAMRDLGHAMATGEYVGWLAYPVGEEHVIAGAGVQLRRLMPRPDDDGTGIVRGREGIVLNMYVEPAYRRRGIARALMDAIIAWAREGHVARLVLHASDEGRSLYESMGFVPTTELRFTGSLLSSTR
jgi:GNAT superfamily N-acetyltransferase